MTKTEAAAKPSRLRQIPGEIWALGFVSLLMDLSSEMIHALLPVYLVTVLGATMTSVGAIEGIAESTASIVKIFSGALSDWLGRRKFLAMLGYGLAALTKPAFPLAQGVDVLIAARFVDRVGKGIRGAPRDALVADIAPEALRGAAFGLRQSLDTIGAFLGPAAAIALMWLSADNFKLVFWAAVPPALLAVALLLVAVKEPERDGGASPLRFPLRFSELARLGNAFWFVTLIGTVFGLAHFSEAFLILRARDAGLPLALTPIVLVAMNVVYAFSAYPAGVLSDACDRLIVLAVGLALLIAADLVLAGSGGLIGVSIGVLLWGLHLGLTQGLLTTLVADVAPADLRGTAFGTFNLLSGLAALAASLIAGALWDRRGAGATFLAGAVFAALALGGLILARWRAPGLGAGHRGERRRQSSRTAST